MPTLYCSQEPTRVSVPGDAVAAQPSAATGRRLSGFIFPFWYGVLPELNRPYDKVEGDGQVRVKEELDRG